MWGKRGILTNFNFTPLPRILLLAPSLGHSLVTDDAHDVALGGVELPGVHGRQGVVTLLGLVHLLLAQPVGVVRIHGNQTATERAKNM